VFDFYNVLTTNGGVKLVNDLGREGGNHHRWRDNQVQHKTDGDHDLNPNVSEYPSSDDHPNRAGNLKATAEFVPLLNLAYNRWKGTTTSTIPVPDGGGNACVVKELFGADAKITTALQAFRDGVLARSAPGRAAIRLYYSASPSLVAALRSTAAAAGPLKELLAGLLQDAGCAETAFAVRAEDPHA
jgi:hypothetical protein